jgi:hypothetical protein
VQIAARPASALAGFLTLNRIFPLMIRTLADQSANVKHSTCKLGCPSRSARSISPISSRQRSMFRASLISQSSSLWFHSWLREVTLRTRHTRHTQDAHHFILGIDFFCMRDDPRARGRR